jgi:hypothetical protein
VQFHTEAREQTQLKKHVVNNQKLISEMTLLVLIGLAVIVMYEPTTALYQCTPQQTMNIGSFKCLPNCDENHIAQGQFGPKKYCLNYFPNGGSCFMKPYTRTDILSCGGKAGGSNPPMWIIMVGGSNMYMMLKTLIDSMLNLPGTAGYNPGAYWGAQSTWHSYILKQFIVRLVCSCAG